MARRWAKVTVEVSVIMEFDDEQTDVDTLIADMDYDVHVCPETDFGQITDTEIMEYEIEKSEKIV